jgi:hypothetical protein
VGARADVIGALLAAPDQWLRGADLGHLGYSGRMVGSTPIVRSIFSTSSFFIPVPAESVFKMVFRLDLNPARRRKKKCSRSRSFIFRIN